MAKWLASSQERHGDRNGSFHADSFEVVQVVVIYDTTEQKVLKKNKWRLEIK